MSNFWFKIEANSKEEAKKQIDRTYEVLYNEYINALDPVTKKSLANKLSVLHEASPERVYVEINSQKKNIGGEKNE